MDRLKFTLLTDGSSDAILKYPITWMLQQHWKAAITGTWADLRCLPNPPKGLRDRVDAALDLYPCDLLFVHRDAEAMPLDRRVAEIQAAVDGLSDPSVPMVPVRMQEAWLLIDEPALRRAAGNPHGGVSLAMPTIDKLEQIPNPKQVLHELLLTASELRGRRRDKFNPGRQAIRLGELIQDYSPLRKLTAFRYTEEQTVAALRNRSDKTPVIDQRREQ